MKVPLNNLSPIFCRFLAAIKTLSTIRKNRHLFTFLFAIVNLEPLTIFALFIQRFENKGCAVLVWALWEGDILFCRGKDQLNVTVFNDVDKKSLRFLGIEFKQNALVNCLMRVIFNCDVLVCLFWLYTIHCAHLIFLRCFYSIYGRNANIIWIQM